MARRARLTTWDDLAQQHPELVINRVESLRTQPLTVLGNPGEDPGVEVLMLPGAVIGPMGVYFDGLLLADDVHYLPPDWPTQDWPAYRDQGDGWFEADGEIERHITGPALFVDSFGGLGNFSHFVRETLPFAVIQGDLLAGGIEAPALLPTWRFPAQEYLAGGLFGPTVEKNDAWTLVDQLLVVRRRWSVDSNPRMRSEYRVPRRELERLSRIWPAIAARCEDVPSGDPIYLWRDWATFNPGIRVEDRSVANGDKVDALLRDLGFRSIDAATTPVEEVIEAVSAAPIVVGLHGAQMAHILWANRHSVHLEFSASEAVNEHHRILADVLGLPTLRLSGRATEVGGVREIDVDDLAATVDALLNAAHAGQFDTRWEFALTGDLEEAAEESEDDGDEIGDQAEPEPPVLEMRDTESVGDYIERVRWQSSAPRDDLHEVAERLMGDLSDGRIDEAPAVAGLVADLRADRYYDAVLSALEGGDSDWGLIARARLIRLRDGAAVLASAVRDQLPRIGALPADLQSRWLALAAKADSQTLRAVVEAITAERVLDVRVPEIDLSMPIDRERRRRLEQTIAAQPRRTPAQAEACVEYLISQFGSERPFRSQSVPWVDYDTFDLDRTREVTQQALDAADAGVGFSCVRLGDGEGLVLAGERANIGGALGLGPDGQWNELAEPEYSAFRDRLGASVRTADFVGIPDLVQCLEGPDGCVDVVLGCLDHAVPSSPVVAGGWDLAWALETSGIVEGLLARCTGIIGPVDPATFVHRHVSDQVDWVRIPGELHMYGEQSSIENSHWTRSAAVLEHPFAPGQLWLVGAGMLGKVYCGAIKEAGGVAIDVGSLMDLWSGRQHTRGTLRYQPWVLSPYGPADQT